MRKTWKYTAILTLLLIAGMQALPFVPTHDTCETACCEKPVSCCESELSTGCDMAMTSCTVSMFMPLVSAPLIKVESSVQLDIVLAQLVDNELLKESQQVVSPKLTLLDETAPPGNLPLLI